MIRGVLRFFCCYCCVCGIDGLFLFVGDENWFVFCVLVI